MLPGGLVHELLVVAPEDGPFVDQAVHLGLQMIGNGRTGPDVVQLAPETVEVSLDQTPPRQDRFTIGPGGHGPSIGSVDPAVTEQGPAPSGGSLRPDLACCYNVATHLKRRNGPEGPFHARYLVGAAGFEPTTTSPPDWCATRLRHAPSRASLAPSRVGTERRPRRPISPRVRSDQPTFGIAACAFFTASSGYS
jgi:hypothetical protein